MTTIAAKLGKRGEPSSLACDLQYTYHGSTKFKGDSKIIVLEGSVPLELFGAPKALIGFSGGAVDWGRVKHWFSNPTEKMPKVKDMEFLMLCKHGIFHAASLSDWVEVDTKHSAIGSGMTFALGALDSGKSPLEAVKTASKFDVYTGMGFKEFVL